MSESLPGHVQWLLDNRGADLARVLQAQGCHLDVRAALQVLVDADPSPGQHGVDWLCRALIVGGLRWEDISAGQDSRAARTLEGFALHRRALPLGGRRLEDYASLGSVYRAIAPMLGADQPRVADDSPVGRALRRKDRATAYSQSMMLCDTPDLVVAVPMTRLASQWWGRGTQWCTAAEQSNMFASYHRAGPLIVLCMPGVPEGKLQLHMYGSEYRTEYESIQFMDVHDDEVDPNYIGHHWQRLGPFMMWLVTQHDHAMRFVPKARRTPDLVEHAILHRPWALAYVPVEERTSGACRLALQGNKGLFRMVPERFRTHAMYADLVRANPELLGWVPDKKQTRRMCSAAVRARGSVLAKVAPQHRDGEMYAIALESTPRALASIPPEYASPELCLQTMGRPGAHLRDVVVEYRTPQVCRAAVLTWPANLGDVPLETRTEELCRIAVAGDGKTMRHVPEPLQTAELYALAVPTHGSAIKHLGTGDITAELCALAVANAPDALAHVPTEFLTADLVAHALQCHPGALRHAPPHLVTQDQVATALVAEPHLASTKATEHMPDSVFMSMLEHNGINLHDIAFERRTMALCTLAVANNADAMDFVPDGLVEAVEVELGLEVVHAPGWKAEVVFAGLAECLASTTGMQTQPRI